MRGEKSMRLRSNCSRRFDLLDDPIKDFVGTLDFELKDDLIPIMYVGTKRELDVILEKSSDVELNAENRSCSLNIHISEEKV